MKPLHVIFYAGPGVGKSVVAMRTAAELKCRHINAEYVGEPAKDHVWDGNLRALGHQPYMAAQLMYWWDRLIGQVDIIVTDTSTLLADIYDSNLTDKFLAWIEDDYRRRVTLPIFLHRDLDLPYQDKGRTQTAEQACEVDQRVKDALRRHGIVPLQFTATDPTIPVYLANYIQALLEL